MLVTVFMNGLDVGFGGFLKTRLLPGLARVLKLTERGEIFFAIAAEPVFLDAEVIELPLIDKQDFGLDEMLADFRLVLIEFCSEIEPAERVDAHFERGDAEQTPFGVGERLDEAALFIARGLMRREEARDMSLVGGGIFVR